MIKRIFLLFFLTLAISTFATVDTLHIELIDSLDAPTNHEFYHYGITSSWPIEYNYSGTDNWDLDMGDSFMVWLPGSRNMIFVDPFDSTELDTVIDPHAGSEDIMLCEIQDSIFFTGGGIYI